MNLSQTAYIIPVFKAVIFPGMETKLKVESSLAAKLETLQASGDSFAIAVSVRQGVSKYEVSRESFYSVGTLLSIEALEESEKGTILTVRGIDAVRLESIEREDKLFYTKYEPVAIENDLSAHEENSLIEQIKITIRETSKHFQGAQGFVAYIDSITDLDLLIAAVIPYMDASLQLKQELLQSRYLKEKFLKFIDLLIRQKEKVELQVEMARKISDKNSKYYRENLLREQMKAIQEELHDGDEDYDNTDDYRKKIELSDMPKDVRKVALAEVKKLESMGQQSSETHVIRNYLDLLLALPWTSEESKDFDLTQARKILDEEHYGLDKVKDRIIQHLAVMKLKNRQQGSILLLAGPPGTGKTSLGKSIANALERKYVRASLGGVRDEAEIRGHRRTYVGALPGRIISGIKKAESKNPVFVLDEIDKLMASYSGDPASALLEVLDPEQNSTFSDHYLEVPYDLSDVFFIATANNISQIPSPLLDRMEVIQISSYTNREKFRIAKDHLIPSVFTDHGITSEQLHIEDSALETIIDRYTREAGVRGLKKKLTEIARVTSEKIVQNDNSEPFTVSEEKLFDILGKELARHDQAIENTFPGVATGLAWTPVGGEILFIETSLMEGKGQLTLTGQLGDVMKESARISMSLIRARLLQSLQDFDFSKTDVHIHVPSGATPKDGPSAGVTLFTALVSLLTGKQVKPKYAMTGEITLSGRVLPVGGIKEKVLAAHRAGVSHVLLPLENEKDLLEIPEDVREEIRFYPVETIEEVVKLALDIDLPKTQFFIPPGELKFTENSVAM